MTYFFPLTLHKQPIASNIRICVPLVPVVLPLIDYKTPGTQLLIGTNSSFNEKPPLPIPHLPKTRIIERVDGVDTQL
jgi:hypothetical protein